MIARRWSLLIVAAVLSMAFAWPAIARAAAAPTKLVMQEPKALPVSKADPQSVMVVGATLTTADGKPIPGQKVEFFMATDILGQKKASIGSASSDSGGSARITFVVNRTGAYELSARFAGTEAFGASGTSALKANFEALASESTAEGLPLSSIGRWVPWAGLGLGVAVWIVLIYVMARVLIVVPRAARRAARIGGANRA